MLALALSSLRSRRTAMAGALAAVALAVALVVSSGILLESSLGAPIRAERLAGAPIVVQGDPALAGAAGSGETVLLTERRRVPERLAARVAGVPGVAQAIADRSFALDVRRPDGRVVGADLDASAGHGWASSVLTPLVLHSGHAPRHPGDVVVSGGLARVLREGDRLRIATVSGSRPVTVVGRDDGRGSGNGVFLRDDVARTLAGTGPLADVIGVTTRPGADPGDVARRIRAAIGLPDVRVLTGAQRGEAESPGATISREDLVAGTTTFGTLAVFVAMLVVSSTFALAIRQRHRELALLRAIGTTPRQVRRMIAGEALLLALAASVVGVPLGIAGAHLERGLFVSADLIPADLEIRFGLLSCLAGVAAAIVTTQVAAFASSRRASRVRPADALREATLERPGLSWVRVLMGLALTAAGIAVLVEASRSGSSGPDDTRPAAIPLLLGAAALLAPLLVTPFAAVLGLPLRLFGGASGSLARANLRSDRGRVAAVATPVMVAAGLVVTFVGAKLDIQHRTIAQAEARTSATDVLAPRAGSTALPPGLVATAAHVPGVERVAGTFATSLVVAVGGNPRVAPARAVEAATLAGVLDPGVTGGSLAALTGTTVAVADETARQFGWHVGDRVTAWLGDGTPAHLTVVATFARPLGFATVLLPRPLASRHATSPVDDLAFVLRRGPVARTQLRLIAAQSGHAQLRSRSEYLADVRGVTAKQALPVFLVLGLIAAFCAVGAVNSLTMAIGGRTQELAVLRQVGATRRQLARMVRAEAAVTVAFGLAVGALVAVPAPQPPLWLYGLLTAGFAVLTLLACVAPTRLALRSGPGGPLPD